MDRRDSHKPQSDHIGICRRLFNFVINNVAARGLKRVTLGRPPGPTSSTSTCYPIPPAAPQNDGLVDIEPVIVQFPQGVTKNDMNLPVQVEETSNGWKNSGSVEVRSTSSRTVPIDDNESTDKLKNVNDEEKVIYAASNDATTTSSHIHDSYIVLEPVVKTQENVSEDVLNTSTSKKTDSLVDNAEEKDMIKRKEKNSVLREKLSLASAIDEPEKDGNVKAPRQLRPVFRAASNINEKSDAFIRRRKEALKRSTTTDPKTQ